LARPPGCGILRAVALATSPTLVGRETELDCVREFLRGDGRAKLLLEGDAGIGKTTLWAAGLDVARERGCRLLQAQPAAAERELSFAALGDLLDDLREEIGALAAPQRRALRAALLLDDAKAEAPDQRTIAVGLTELLRRTARDAHVVIAVDDAHWLDGPSALAIDFASRRLVDEPVRLLATARADNDAPLDFAPAERLTVGPLTVDELDELIRTRLDIRLFRPAIRQLADASGGNPFYALELAESVLRSGRTPEPGERLSIPTHLRAITTSRLDTLSPRAREAILATAALAQPTASVVANVVGSDAAIAEAVAAGVLERHGDSLRFTHPLFAASAYEDASPGRRKAMHVRLGRVVTEPEERARQLAEAADGPDARIATFVEAAAARVAARGAPDAAVRLAKLAVELTPAGRRNAMHKRRLDCARYAFAAGDPAYAETLLQRQLADTLPGRERAEVELELGRAVLATDGAAAAMAHYDRALAEVDGSDELELQALILTELAEMHAAHRRMDSDASARAIALAEQVWNPELLARALGIHGAMMVWNDKPLAEGDWKRALEVERSTGQLRYMGPAYAYALARMFRLDYKQATESFLEVAESMRRRDDPMLQAVLLLLSDISRNAGRWADAAAYADEAHDVVLQTGRQSVEPECLTVKARLAMLRGELDLAHELGHEALATLTRLAVSNEPRAVLDGTMIEALVNSIFARSAQMSGDHARAHPLFVKACEYDRSMGVDEWVIEGLADDVASLVALGRLDEARRALAEIRDLRPRVSDGMAATAEALEARTEGVLAAADGDYDGAIAALERARDLIESMPAPWPYERARTLLTLGRAQRRTRKRAEARRTLEDALAIFDELGSNLWAEHARNELVQLGGRPLQTSALTETEARGAATVAAGCSNAEAARELFMSPKTVEWNLSKIYKKLHVRSRAELAAKLAKQSQS
jgi:DNA-binding CsgD family transcriptional regulator